MTVKTAGEALSWSVIALLGLNAIVQPLGCAVPETPAESSDMLQQVLANVGPAVVVPTLERFLTEADELLLATVAWRDALEAGGDGEVARAAAQQAWRDAFVAWEEAELHLIGPAAIQSDAIAAEGLRDEVYSWPTVSPCLVDQKTADGSYLDEDFLTANRVNAYGVDALEYLLFAPDRDNACGASLSINTTGAWTSLGDAVDLRRAEMAVRLAEEAVAQSESILSRWTGDFAGALTAEDGSPYSSSQEALNAVYDALFYLESTTKDRKLAQPMGLRDCDTDLCPEAVEAPWSGDGSVAIASNLRGFRTLFTGGDGAGIDDLLDSLGHGDLADRILTDVDVAIEQADLLSDLQADLVQDPASVMRLHDAIVTVTDSLKGDLVTVLSVQVPVEFQGDTD